MKLPANFFIAVFVFLMSWPGLLHSETTAFASFDVQPYEGNIVIIQWSMTPERDTLPMEVERSRDRITWEKISLQPSQSSHQYFSIDSRPEDGLIYYRVRRTEGENKISYSDVRWVQVCKTDEVYIWPNPAKDILHVKTPFSKGSMDILDAGGKLMQKIAISGFNTEVPAACLSKGIYFLHIRHDDEVIVEKFIKE